MIIRTQPAAPQEAVGRSAQPLHDLLVDAAESELAGGRLASFRPGARRGRIPGARRARPESRRAGHSCAPTRLCFGNNPRFRSRSARAQKAGHPAASGTTRGSRRQAATGRPSSPPAGESIELIGYETRSKQPAMHGLPLVSDISKAQKLRFLGAKLAKKHEAVISVGIRDPLSTAPRRKLSANQLSSFCLMHGNNLGPYTPKCSETESSGNVRYKQNACKNL